MCFPPLFPCHSSAVVLLRVANLDLPTAVCIRNGLLLSCLLRRFRRVCCCRNSRRGDLKQALKCYARTRDYCTTNRHSAEMCLHVIEVICVDYMPACSRCASGEKAREKDGSDIVGRKAPNKGGKHSFEHHEWFSCWCFNSSSETRARVLCRGKRACWRHGWGSYHFSGLRAMRTARGAASAGVHAEEGMRVGL